jgi:hypothetical protein
MVAATVLDCCLSKEAGVGVKEWTQLGAARRIHEIEAELAQIRRAFPRLIRRAGRRVQSGAASGTLIPERGHGTP